MSSMLSPKMGTRLRPAAEVPRATSTLPPPRTYFRSSLSNEAGSAATLERTTKAYFEGDRFAACSIVTTCWANADSAAEPSASPK